VVTIATPPIQITTARTCSARAIKTSSMLGPVRDHRLMRDSAHSRGISGTRPKLWTSRAPGAKRSARV
jgi:hypothetical protein